MNQKLRVSIVIPVYNEERYLPACLEAIAAQTVIPYEVIVVDNNSSDNTAKIAQRHSFVKLLRQKKQGVVFARDTGFNAAKGEIIGRIDADSVIDSDWVASVQTVFEDNRVGAATGKVHYQDVVASQFVSQVDLFWRRRMARLLGRDVALQGANMAIRRSVWQQVRYKVCHKTGQHEDFDLAIHANQAENLVVFDERLVADVHCRQVAYNFRAFSHYVFISPRTYSQHGLKSGRHMYQVVLFVLAFYWPIKLLHRGYSSTGRKFSWLQLFSPIAPARVNPATFVE